MVGRFVGPQEPFMGNISLHGSCVRLIRAMASFSLGNKFDMDLLWIIPGL